MSEAEKNYLTTLRMIGKWIALAEHELRDAVKQLEQESRRTSD